MAPRTLRQQWPGNAPRERSRGASRRGNIAPRRVLTQLSARAEFRPLPSATRRLQSFSRSLADSWRSTEGSSTCKTASLTFRPTRRQGKEKSSSCTRCREERAHRNAIVHSLWMFGAHATAPKVALTLHAERFERPPTEHRSDYADRRVGVRRVHAHTSRAAERTDSRSV